MGEIFNPTSNAVSGGGQQLVTKVVAPSGGDYTTLGAALADAQPGWTIWIAPGTYSEGAITCAVNDIIILGAGPDQAILDFSTNVWDHSGANLTINDVQLNFTTGRLNASGNYLRIENSTYIASGTGSNMTLSGQYLVMSSNLLKLGGTASISTSYFVISDNVLVQTSPSSTQHFLYTNGTEGSITSNNITVSHNSSNSGKAFIFLGSSNVVCSQNTIVGTGNDCVGIQCWSGQDSISDNNLYQLTQGVVIQTGSAGQNNINGNNIYLNGYNTGMGAGIELNNNSDNVVCDNFIYGYPTPQQDGIHTTGSTNVINGNRIQNFSNGVNVAGGTNNLVTCNVTSGCTTATADTGTTTLLANNI